MSQKRAHQNLADSRSGCRQKGVFKWVSYLHLHVLTRTCMYLHAVWGKHIYAYVCITNSSGWFVYTNTGYSGLGTFQTFTVEKSENLTGYNVYNSYGGSYWNGGTYAPYYDFGRLEYSTSTMYSYSSGYYLGITGTQYWYAYN